MPTQTKIDAVAEIKGQLENNDIAIITSYVGISVEDVTALRKELREAGVEYKVYKNNLAKIALTDLGLEGAAEHINGPTGWAFSNDPVAPAKVLKAFSKKVNVVSMDGGVLDGQVVDKAQLEALADLPSREQLLAQIAGCFAAPMSNMAALLNAPLQNMAGLIDALEQKKAGEAA